MTLLKGIVTKAGVMEKTITVTVERKVIHPTLLKQISQHKKYLVHDPNSTAQVGQRVTIKLGKPVSARKSFHLVEGSPAASTAAPMESSSGKVSKEVPKGAFKA